MALVVWSGMLFPNRRGDKSYGEHPPFTGRDGERQVRKLESVVTAHDHRLGHASRRSRDS